VAIKRFGKYNIIAENTLSLLSRLRDDKETGGDWWKRDDDDGWAIL